MSNDKFLDETEGEFQQRQKVEDYFGIFSENARKRLLSANVTKPESIYDVYEIHRRHLLSKNVSLFNDNILDTQAEIFRNKQLVKNNTQETDLDELAETERQRLVSKNQLLKSNIEIEENCK